ncbi:hypothetical protein D3C85_1468470 [compost metagenome]
MSGLTDFMRSTMLLKSRVGLGCLTTSFTSKPCCGNDLDRSAAVPVPKSESSCTIITVLAGLPAASFSAARSMMARSLQAR